MSKLLRSPLYILSTLLLYDGIPLLGWGLGDLRGYLSSPARAGYLLAVLAFALAVGWQAIYHPEGIRGGAGDAASLVPRQRWVRIGMVLSLYLTLIFLPLCDRHGWAVFPAGEGLRWAGVALCALGYGFVFWSGLALGRMYSQDVTLQPDHHLITGGPYRLVRHPRYLGLLLVALGMALVFRAWTGLALLPALGAILALRIHDEEALMRQQFGAEWDVYARRTARLLPYLF